MWSDEMFRILDLSPNEILAHKDFFTELVIVEDRTVYQKWMDKVSAIAGESSPIQVKIKSPHGKLKHVIVNGISYEDNLGRIYKFIGVV